MRKAIYAIFVIALLLSSCVPAYGADRAYFQPEAWINNSDIYSENINKKSNSNILEGVFKYYFDAQNNIFYTYLSISETSLSENRCDVRLVYTVGNAFDTYSLSVDKDGICDTSYALKDYFTAEQSFTTYKESNSGLYLSSIAINTECDHNDISVKLYINGHIYKIIENIPLDKMTEREIVSQSEIVESTDSPTTVTDKKTSKSTTAKKVKTTKAQTAATTKFHYNPDAGTYNSTVNQQKNTEAATVTSVTVYNSTAKQIVEEKKGTVSSSAKVCCIVAGACALSGISFLLAAAISKSNKAESE